jgi:ABC-type oligopeptide transport system substrate-binding subunit
MRRLPSVIALVLGSTLLGVSLLAPSAVGGGAATRELRLNISTTEVSYLDPALSYDFIGWRLEMATCARLLTYPDKPGVAGARLTPEVAAGFPRVSGNGRVYTFTVRSDFRFSDGRAVTAGSFRRAIERALDPKMQSPASSFVGDVAGAAAVQAGKATTPSGVSVNGNRLVVRLQRPAPDFLSRIAMMFFCAVPEDFPIDPKGLTPPGSGPYYVASFEPKKTILIKRNPYYGGDRPQRWDEMRITPLVNAQTSYLQVRKGEIDLDLGGLPPVAHAELTKQYGINKGRYFVNPGLIIQYLALNTQRPLFAEQATRQAIAYAIDRTALMRTGGLNAGRANDQILPPGLPGYEPITVYPNRPDVARAKELLGGRTGKVVLYAGNDPASLASIEILRQNLKAVGLTLEARSFTFAVQITKAGTRGEPFDMNMIGWFADYPDPYDFVNVLLSGTTIAKENNINTAYFDDPGFNGKMNAAARLTGKARETAYARLDRELTVAAPFAVYGNSNVREFVSARIGCPMYSVPAGGLNLVMLCERK